LLVLAGQASFVPFRKENIENYLCSFKTKEVKKGNALLIQQSPSVEFFFMLL
jgi:hypothetical protein